MFLVLGGESNKAEGTFEGLIDGQVFDRIDVFFPTTNTWTLSPRKMDIPRHGIFPLLVGDDVFCSGGGETKGFAVTSLVTTTPVAEIMAGMEGLGG